MPLYSSKPKSPDKVSRSKVNTDLSDVVPPIKKSGKQPNAIRPEAIKQLIKKGHRPQLPPMLKPMMASLANESFSDPGWLFELKYDGYRAMALIQRGEVELFSRNNISYKSKFFPIAEALQRWTTDVILDGEITILDENGISNFQQLQSWQRTGKGDLIYYVFDILWIDGFSLIDLPLIERKEILAALIPEDGLIRYSDHIVEKGKAFFKLAVEQGLEGIIAKKADSTYHPGIRSHQWLKIKTRQTQEAVIAGFTEGRGGRKHFGALILGIYHHNKFIYIGHTGSGLDDKGLVNVYKRLQPLITAKCPFLKKPKTNMAPTWVRPEIVCEVKFQEWTNDNLLRIPIFLRLRDDKKAIEITKENSIEHLALTCVKTAALSLKPVPESKPAIVSASRTKRSGINSGMRKPQ